MLSYTLQGIIGAPILFFFHGFLGCKEDWDDCLEHLDLPFCKVCVDLPGHGSSDCAADPLQDILSFVKSFPRKGIAIGYSMGGRIALQLYEKEPELFSKYILLSSHLGLATAEEKIEKKRQEDLWMSMLESKSFPEFLEHWYNQSLFSGLRESKLLQKIMQRRSSQNPKALAKALSFFSLSSQSNFTSLPPHTALLYGEKDEKYKQLFEPLSSTVRVEKISKSGHALHIENPKECADKIKSIIQKDLYAT